MTRLRLAAASFCGVSGGILIWAVTVIDRDMDRRVAQLLAEFALLALASSGWLAYTAYRRPSSRLAMLATGLAASFTALVILAWVWTFTGLAWCASHPCGD
jgi:hypothetical protein